MRGFTNKAQSITKASYYLGVIWTLSLIVGTILVSLLQTFNFWWILIIISILSTALLLIHIKITKNISNNIEVNKNISILHWLCFLQVLVINFPLFAYEVIGIVFYKKVLYML